jgi:hypothetical protein
MTRSNLRHAIRWRAPRTPRVRRKPIDTVELPLVRVRTHEPAANDAAVDPIEEAPETLRDPSVVVVEQQYLKARPAVFDALCASLDVLAAEHVPCELDVVVDAGATARLYRDPDLASRLMSPFVARMPDRDGLIPVGTIRIAGRRVRIYERAA